MEELADEIKVIGNKFFQAKDYKTALRFYSEAIAVRRKPIYFCNRAACYILLGDYTTGLENAQNAVIIDEIYVRGYLQIVRCGVALRKMTVAEKAIRRLRELNVSDSVFKAEMENYDLFRMKLADEKKIIGNQLFQAKNYKNALHFYSEAIAVFRNPIYFCNRAACHILLEDYNAGLEDAQNAVSIDKSFVNGYLRIVRCGLALGEVNVAEKAIRRLRELKVCDSLFKSDIEKCDLLRMSVNAPTWTWSGVLGLKRISWAMKIAPASLKFKMIKADCLFMLGYWKAANDLAVSCLQVNPELVEANYVHGMFIFYNESFERGVAQFLQVLTRDPQNAKAKAMCAKADEMKAGHAKGKELFADGNFRAACNVYTDTLTIEPLVFTFNSIIYYDRAVANAMLGDLWETINDCNAAIKANSKYIEPVILLGQCHIDIRNYEEAIDYFRLALKLHCTAENRRLLDAAIDEFQKYNKTPKDFYLVLGASQDATQSDVKKAYYKKAKIHHPDRHAKATAEMQRKQEVRFKEVDEAYRVLGDFMTRRVYDKSQGKTM